MLQPGQVDGAEGVAGDAGGAVVEILVNVAVEKGVQVHEALGRGQADRVPNTRIGEPLLNRRICEKSNPESIPHLVSCNLVSY